MASVTKRVSVFKQPRGGFVKISDFDSIVINDDFVLNESENLGGSVVGLVVDYLTRLIMGADSEDAFRISLEGARIAEELGVKEGAMKTAKKLLKGISDMDDDSIVNACELVTFDVWKRNTLVAMMISENSQIIPPDRDTIDNIRFLLIRSITFWGEYGPIAKDGFNFAPPKCNVDTYKKMLDTGKGTYGGYTPTVSSGDGDFLTADTLWDFKVLRSKPTSKDTLQLLMYWIMGQHSGQDIFKSITKIGLFNPRSNTVYLKEVSTIPNDIIKTVENDVICY
ncbi:MAG: hypothetical protein IKZ59_06395 [Clostridia bacterium]|nr:hypothetical protein [Clostridia bacterium]